MTPAPSKCPILRVLPVMLAAASMLAADENPHLIDDPLAAEAALLTSGFTSPAAITAADPTGQGSWGTVIPWSPHIPVTAATLPDGRLLTFASNQRTTFPSGQEFTYAAVWDPLTGVFTEINNARHDMFCGGTAMLPDGRVVVNGGRNTTVLSSIFDFRTNQWNPLQNMNDPRWYNPSVALPDGTVFTVSGSGGSNTAELWNSATGWRRLTGVNWSAVTSQPGYINIWHPFLMLAPNGRLFHFGPTDTMNWVTTAGSGSLTASGQNVPGQHYPKEGAWAMYDEGRIVVAGGGANTTQNPSETSTGVSTHIAFTVDLNNPAPVITPAAPMQFPRQFANSVVLPNGEVMVIGGNTSGLKFNDTGSVLTPELWNPRTETWRTLANMAVPRNYHSLALLLPDGRVWSGGGGLGGNSADHRDAQIFTPPALFAANGSLAVRPVITESPAKIGPGARFTVRASPGIAKFAFIRMSAQTHSVNTDLRYLSLPFTETSPGVYSLTGRANSNVMLPGYWMLFGLDSQSVHSVARIIQVSLNPDVTVLSPGDQKSTQGDAIQLPLSVSAPPTITTQFSATGLPPGLSLDPATGVISGTITAAPGDYLTTIVVTPGTGALATSVFNWNVALPNSFTGTILREWWLGITGANLSDLTNNPAYPADPSGSNLIFSLETPSNWADNHGQRVRGYLHPAVTGQYRFWIAGDDESRLLLSPDHNPANAVRIANAPSWTNPREWTKFAEQSSTLITLEAGKRYYIEALMKEGVGGDHLAVGWKPPGAAATEVIAGQFLSPFNPVLAPAAAWQLDERTWNGTSNEVRELVGLTTGIHGTAVGGAVTSPIAPALDGNPGTGRAGSFDGNSQYLRIPFHAALNPNDFTVSAWVRPQSLTSADWRSVVVSRQFDGNNIAGFGLYASPDGKWTFFTGPAWTGLTGVTIAADQWSHVAATFRTTGVAGSVRTGIRRIFVDGVLVAEDTGTYVPITSTALFIGASKLSSGNGDYMIGRIDEVRIHAMPLGGSDVANAMALRHRFNFSPTLTSPGLIVSARASIVSQAIQASDLDGDALTYSAAGLPAGLSISPSSGIVSGSPLTIGDFNPTITATDPAGDSGSISLAWSIVENLSVTPVTAPPSPFGSNVTFSASASGGRNPRYKWNFGDGSADTAFSTSANATHGFAGPGRYLVTVTATDDTGLMVTSSFHQAVHAPLAPNKPAASSAIAYEDRSSGNDRLWVVNPDNDSVTVIDAVTRARLVEIPVGTSPKCVAIAPNGRIWVTNADGATVSILRPDTLTILQSLSLPRGSRPFGLAFSPDATAAFIALENSGRLLKLDPVSGAQLASIDVGPNVRHLSIPGDGSRVYLSRFITPRLTGEDTAAVNTTGQGGEVLVINANNGVIQRTLRLGHSERADTAISARGIPNYLGAPTLTPDGLSAWIPSKQDNVKRGKLRDLQDLNHDMTVRAIASRLDLTLQAEDLPARVDFDNAGVPSAIACDPWGIHAFVALEASRAVAVIDVWNHLEILRFDVGRAPQGLTLSPDGRTLFVHNFMDRSVSIHDVSAVIQGADTSPPAPVVVSTLTTEKLPPQILIGKQLFYDAKDNRLALQEYLSCAACHNDGGHDGRVWDLTGFGEGLRNTIALRGHGGTRQGPLHWSANFDEVQDFENQIRNLSGGLGLISPGSPHPPLGSPNAGRSTDLDALAAYLQSLDKFGDSPHRANDGGLTTNARAGETVFRTLNCASCHGGPEFTLSAAGNLPNIGTLKPGSGKRLGENLTGLDIPTLRGLWNSAPYLHDGSAATLAQAVTAHQGVTIGTADLANLVVYLQSIDDQPAAAPLPKTQFAGWAEVTPGTDGNPASNADGDLFPDLLEFALNGLPNTGASPAADAVTLEETSGNLALVVKRPAGLTGVTCEVLTSPDLASWTPAPAPLVQSAADGLEILRFENLQNQPGLSADTGFARLRVTGAGYQAMTLPMGWQAVNLGTASRTVGIPFRETPVFSSSVTGISGARLFIHGTPPAVPAFRGYLEVTTGSHAGHRFDVAATAAGEITIQPAAMNTLAALPNLTGSQVVLCAHHTLGGIFTKTLFKGSTNPSAADQLQFYLNDGATGQFQLFYLLDARPGNPTYQWRAFLPGGGDQAGRVIPPGEGVLVKRPSAAPSSRLLLRGQVRANPFVQPLQPGINLVSSPIPVAHSPRQRGLLDPAAPFAASTNLNAADQFQLYQSGAFRVFYLLDHPTLENPWREVIPGSPNHNDLPVFSPVEAVFLKKNQASPAYRIPLTWSP